MSLGQRIRQLRESRGLTQQRLAGPELSKSFISLLERDQAKPSLVTIANIAQRLGTTVDSLLSTEGHAPEVAVHSLLTLSADAIRTGKLDTAERFLDTVSFLTSQYPLNEALRESYLLQARVAFERRDYERAWALLEQGKRLAETAKDLLRCGRALTLMGRVKLRKRELHEALRFLDDALAVLRRAHASRDPARVEALIATGTSFLYVGDLDRALRRYEEAARAFAARHDHRLRGQALWGIGLIYRKNGQFERARAHLLQAKDAFEAAEELVEFMQVLHNIGEVDLEEGHPRLALQHFEQALRVMERANIPSLRVNLLIDAARARDQAGDHDEALQLARTTLEEAKVVGDPIEINEAQALLGRILLHEKGDKALALQLLRTAIDGFNERGMRGRVAAIATEVGMLLRQRREYAEASEFLSIVVGLSARTPNTTGSTSPDHLQADSKSTSNATG